MLTLEMLKLIMLAPDAEKAPLAAARPGSFLTNCWMGRASGQSVLKSRSFAGQEEMAHPNQGIFNQRDLDIEKRIGTYDIASSYLIA
jgi:hypothetical protein